MLFYNNVREVRSKRSSSCRICSLVITTISHALYNIPSAIRSWSLNENKAFLSPPTQDRWRDVIPINSYLVLDIHNVDF